MVNVAELEFSDRFHQFKQRSDYLEIANLLTFSLNNFSSEVSQRIFGYIPSLFREIAIANSSEGIPGSQLQLGEPVIYKINFPQNRSLKEIPYFYLFCYLKENSSHLNVYFQSATKSSKNLKQSQYTIAQEKINFEGIISAFKDNNSTICISDPGHFIPDLISSFYVGNRQINFPELISNLVESICQTAKIKLENTFLFGSSAGGMGALLSSTYFTEKVQVLAVNPQIITYDRVRVMKTLLETSDRNILLKKFANRVSCLNRFQQNIQSIPNIYLLANINDDLYKRNYKFYQLYQEHFVAKGKNNQAIFDSYVGVEGHGRPDKAMLKQKIEIARISLLMKANQSNSQTPKKVSSTGLKLGYGIKQDFIPFAHIIDDQPQYNLALEQGEYKTQSLTPKTDLKVGQISSDNAAIVGKDGWFYISSGTNYLTEYHTGIRRLPLLKVKQWGELLAQRIRWHQEQKINYQHIFIPNKIAVYPEYYPHSLEIKSDRPIIQLQQQCDQPFAYPLDLFKQYKNKYRLYEKQDSHWNFWGCYLAYQLICQNLHITPNPELINFPIQTSQVKGDLGAKFALTEITLQKKLQLHSQVIYDNQVINYSHQGSIRVLQNKRIKQGKMIIFGDSFSNPGVTDYSPDKRLIARLSTLFAETLNEVHFVWTPWIDYDYIAQEKPDFVLTEMAERFLVRVPNDFDHLPIKEFAAAKLSQFI